MKELQQLSHKPWLNCSFHSCFWSQPMFLHPYLASSHKSLPSFASSASSKSYGNHAIFRSCRMVTTSMFPASLLENLYRIPVQSIKYREIAHLVIQVGLFKCFKHAYKCIAELMQLDSYICPTWKKKKKHIKESKPLTCTAKKCQRNDQRRSSSW